MSEKELEEKIIKLVREEKGIKTSEIAYILKKDLQTISELLKKLEKKKILKSKPVWWDYK